MNNIIKKLKKINLVFLLTSIAALLSFMPVLLAAPALRAARLVSEKAVHFWIVQLILIGTLWITGLEPLAISLLTSSLLVGLYTEIYNRKKNLFIAGIISVVIASVVSVVSLKSWFISKGLSLEAKVLEQIQLIIKQAQTVNSVIQLDSSVLMSQTPSALISLMVVGLALSLILEKSLISSLGVTSNINSEHLNLRDFKLPDFIIWVSLFSLLFSFVTFTSKAVNIVSMNVLNIMVVLYFFQGLAVVESFFIALRFSFFLRLVTYFILLVQLFLIVAAIGFSDFWIGFRSRFLKKKLV